MLANANIHSPHKPRDLCEMMNGEKKLPRSQPEEQGVPSSAITAFLEAVEKRKLELHSFMFLRHGHVIAEGWWSPYRPEYPHMLFSLTKIFTATAVGLAVEEGRLTLEDKVTRFFPEYNRNHLDPHKSALNVRHLLTMSAGQSQPAMGADFRQRNTSWVKHFLEIPLDHEPSQRFVYNGGASHMLAAIVQKITGQPLIEYMQPRLFGPLGIEEVRWETDPCGLQCGGFGLILRTEDIAKMGQLYLQHGRWEERQILSQNWVEQATSLQISTADRKGHPDSQQGYGYQFWLSRHGAFRGDGAHGQLCIVLPRQDAVIAITGGDNNMGDMLQLVWDHLLSGMLAEPVSADESQQLLLSRKLSTLAYSPANISKVSDATAQVTGRRYLIKENPYDIQAMSFEFKNEACIITLWDEQGMHRIVAGHGTFIEGETTMSAKDLHHQCRLPVMKVAASGTWIDKSIYRLTLRYLETPFCDTITCVFDGVQLQIEHKVNVNNGPLERETLQGLSH